METKRSHKGEALPSDSVLHTELRSRSLSCWIRTRPRSIRRFLRRPPYVAVLLTLKYLAIVATSVFLLTPIIAPSYTHLPPHYQRLSRRCSDSDFWPGCANAFNEKVFISVILYDRGGNLASGKWGDRVIDLINMIGPENAFLSIYESDSGPEAQEALEAFEKRVPCRSKIVSEARVSLADFHNVTLPDGSQRTKRVAFLSELRNRALRPLDRYTGRDGVTKYDKVLFLNDIVFRPVEAAQLLFSTNAGAGGRAKYLAACSVDFWDSSKIYDIYALRDADGYPNSEPMFPFFENIGRGQSRADIWRHKDAVRVKSCWGGMMAVQAQYIQNTNKRLPSSDFQDLGSHVIDPDHPANVTAPVRFRHEPEPFYDACECCLFAADLAQVATSAGAAHTGIYLNPYVRVAYQESVLKWQSVVQRWERLFVGVFQFKVWFAHLQENPYRDVQEGEPFTEEVWDGDRWRLVERRGRSGLFCGVRDMQVLRPAGERHGDANWINTRLPPGQTLDFRSSFSKTLQPTWRLDYMASSPSEREDFFEMDSADED